MAGCSSSTVVAFATIFAICALALIAVGFSTDHWQEIDVRTDRFVGLPPPSGHPGLPYYDRNHGLFRICFPDSPGVLDSIDDKPDASCVKQELEIPERDVDDDPSDNYWTRVHLLRATVAFFIICLLLLLIGIILGCLGCWRMSVVLARAAGILVLLAAFFGVGGMAMWHGAEYLEWEKIEDPQLYRVINFPQQWEQTLKDNSEKSYGWSFIITWIGVGLCLIAGILYLVAAATLLFKLRKRATDTYDARRATLERSSRSHSPYATKDRFEGTMGRMENAPIVYTYDSNYLKKQPFNYPNHYEGSINGSANPAPRDGNNAWGWNV